MAFAGHFGSVHKKISHSPPPRKRRSDAKIGDYMLTMQVGICVRRFLLGDNIWNRTAKRPIDRGLFEDVAEKLKISKRLVEEIYYKHYLPECRLRSRRFAVVCRRRRILKARYLSPRNEPDMGWNI